ncbi:hypothetical protein [Bradyrhizobium sp. Gha]|uniref:hypothetical protein n=1 Tax=Bradyrhizobium sp. Gha TaxID=1855318 RepID=UPI0008E8BD16|nr:hypothetical protein [Bradyrhizobium sp. Gha]SFJ71820.1 hypothetical protein SAMN05216525_13315 [Bradyrhizobium sp. Gha]
MPTKISDAALDDPAQTIAQFCRAESLSKSSYYALRRRGLGPDERRVPGTKIIRITAEAHAAWRERIDAFARTEAAQLETERRRKLASIAGQIAAQSPRHVSRRRAGQRRPR